MFSAPGPQTLTTMLHSEGTDGRQAAGTRLPFSRSDLWVGSLGELAFWRSQFRGGRTMMREEVGGGGGVH